MASSSKMRFPLALILLEVALIYGLSLGAATSPTRAMPRPATIARRSGEWRIRAALESVCNGSGLAITFANCDSTSAMEVLRVA